MRAGRGARVERAIEGALTTGLVASGALFVLGLGLGADPLLKWGIVLLMLTPVARVVILTVGLLLEGDWLFGLVSLFVLGVLLSGIVVSVRLGPGQAPAAPAAEGTR